MNVARMWLRLPGDTDRRPLAGHFSAQGFGDDDDLWPRGSSSFSGYQLLLEYFTFREKFMFTGLHGPESVVFPPICRGSKSRWCWRSAGSTTLPLAKNTCASTAYR